MASTNPEYTICEVLRGIYHASEDPEIRTLARVATTMAKRMEMRLREYRADWDKGFWDWT